MFSKTAKKADLTIVGDDKVRFSLKRVISVSGAVHNSKLNHYQSTNLSKPDLGDG